LTVCTPTHAHKARNIALSNALIGGVLRIGSKAKVTPPVVRLVSVDMVHRKSGPLPGHVKPREAIGAVKNSIDANLSVSVAANPPAHSTNPNTDATVTGPDEIARLRVVGQQFF
jgi:hypothetical protein